MARNGNAGKSTGQSKSAKYYRENKKARDKKKSYDAKKQKEPSAVKKRVEANKANRKAGTYGNGDKKDASHTKSGKIVMESRSKNRARNGAKKGRAKSAKRTGTKK
jgi:hypothetical protein